MSLARCMHGASLQSCITRGVQPGGGKAVGDSDGGEWVASKQGGCTTPHRPESRRGPLLLTVLGMHCTVLFTLLLAQAIVDPASFARAAKLSLLQLSEVPQEDLNGLIAELGVATLQLKLQIKAAIKDAASVSSTPIADQTSAPCASSTGKEVRCLRCGACSPPPPPPSRPQLHLTSPIRPMQCIVSSTAHVLCRRPGHV